MRAQKIQARMTAIMLASAVQTANQQTTEELFSGAKLLK